MAFDAAPGRKSAGIPGGRLRLVVYAPYPGVSWSISFQESEDGMLTTDIPKMVKSIENSTEVLRGSSLEGMRAHMIALLRSQNPILPGPVQTPSGVR